MPNSAVFYQRERPTITVRDAPVYQANARELVVRVEAIGINPSDYRLKDGVVPTSMPHGVGSDLVGIVEQIGQGVKGFVVGDRVAGYSPFHFSLFCSDSAVPGGVLTPDTRYAAFQRYAVVFEDGVMKVPQQISISQAATLGCAYATAAQGIWKVLEYKRPSFELPVQPPQAHRGTLLVWGGSSCVGSYAIQFARLSGVRVVATASPRSFEYVMSLGADRVYDYKAPDVVERLRKEGIVDVFDAISAGGSPEQVVDILRGRGGRVAFTLPLDIEWPPEIKHELLWVPEIYKDEYKELPRWLYHSFSPKFIENGLIHPSNVFLVNGSLEKVKDMVYLQKEGKVNGKKPVLVLA